MVSNCHMRLFFGALAIAGVAACGRPPARFISMSLCDLSADFSAYRNRRVAIRGVFFDGLRQQCPQSCATGSWPSFVDLVGSDVTGEAVWATLDQAERTAEREASRGRRVEVWVTVQGILRASDRRSPAGPCDRVVNGGFGHLASFPAQIVVERVDDIQIVPNAGSPYDYSRPYRGAL